MFAITITAMLPHAARSAMGDDQTESFDEPYDYPDNGGFIEAPELDLSYLAVDPATSNIPQGMLLNPDGTVFVFQEAPRVEAAPDPFAERTTAPTPAPSPASVPADGNPHAITNLPPTPPPDPRIIRFHLADGTIVSGRLSINTLAVDTRFGRLNIPIENIRYVKPGLDSRPQQKEKATLWIEQLKSETPAERQAAAAELLKLGPPIRQTLRDIPLDEPGPRPAELRKLIEALGESIDSEFPDPADLTTLDVVATSLFTITGRIVPQSFDLESEFGPLKMSLADLQRADRNTGEAEEEKKFIALSQDNFIARTMKNTGLRVEKGDRLTFTATGQLNMQRWGNVISTPEGAPNTGWFVNAKIYNGAVCMRIGNSGQIIKVGNKLTHTATEAGILHLGIAMVPRFATDGTQYPGEYKVEIKLRKK